MNPLRLQSLLLLCAVASLPASAGIYRWTDAAGHVHFGDRVPGDGATAERIKTPADVVQPDPEVQRQREQSRKLLEVWDAERRERDETAATGAKQAAERGQACARMRGELDRARRAAFLVREGTDGKREVFDSAERTSYERELADALATHCD